MSRFGATGRFPAGMLNKSDEGELQFGVGHSADNVQIEFGKPVAWIAMPPETAERLGMLLLKHAGELRAEIAKEDARKGAAAKA